MSVSPATLRGRLVLAALVVGVSFAVLFGAGATWRLHQLEDRAVHTALLSRLDLARDEVAHDGMLSRDRDNPKTDLVQVVAPDGTVRSSSPALAGVATLVRPTVVLEPSGVRLDKSLQRPDIDLALLAVPIGLSAKGSSDAGTGVLIVAVDAESFTSATSDLLGLLIVGLLSVVIGIVLLSWWLTGRALKSVTRLTEEAESVRAGQLAGGLPVPQQDAELARLVGALNRMLMRLHDSHRRELAFAADAGHRLRTPIATLRAEAELATRETDPTERLVALRQIVMDADQLTVIVDRMLARSRSGGAPAEPVRTALDAAVPSWVRQGELSGVTVSAQVDPTVDEAISCAGLVDVLEPLVDNAIRHAQPEGRVWIRVRTGGRVARSHILVEVKNTGMPIAPNVAARIFDAWVSSRDASVAGGLGLWSARESARDLGGDVSLVESSGSTTTFHVELPVLLG